MDLPDDLIMQLATNDLSLNEIWEELKKQAQAAYAKGEIPWDIQHKLQALPRNSHPTRIQKRCGLCGRPRAVYKKFGLCRLCLRKYAMRGYIPGLTKASW